MAQRIVTTCDLCPDGKAVDGTPVVIRIDKVERVLDVCDGHRTEWLGDLLDAMQQWGRPSNGAVAPKVKAGDGACPECDKRVRLASLPSHLERKHGYTALKAVEARTLAAEAIAGHKFPHECEVCKANGVQVRSEMPQGIGAHTHHFHR